MKPHAGRFSTFCHHLNSYDTNARNGVVGAVGDDVHFVARRTVVMSLVVSVSGRWPSSLMDQFVN